LSCKLQPQLAKPALLAEPNSDSIKQIKLIIEQALNSKNILISQSAFTQKSQLIVQLKEVYTLARFNNPKFVSEFDKPDRFIFIKDSRGCLLRHEKNNREWHLEGINCVIAKKAKDAI
jgi:hypothetical protein